MLYVQRSGSLIIDASTFQVSVPFSESQGQIFTVRHKSRQHQFCRCASCSRRRALICAIYHAALNPRLLSRDLRFQTPSISRTTICSAIFAPNANFNHFFLTNPLCCTNPSPLHWWSAVDRVPGAPAGAVPLSHFPWLVGPQIFVTLGSKRKGNKLKGPKVSRGWHCSLS